MPSPLLLNSQTPELPKRQAACAAHPFALPNAYPNPTPTPPAHQSHNNPKSRALLDARSQPQARKSNRAALVGLGERNSLVNRAEKTGETSRGRGGLAGGYVRRLPLVGLDQAAGDA